MSTDGGATSTASGWSVRRSGRPGNDGFFLDQGENPASIVVDIGGVYQDTALFPTEVSTIWWEDPASKELYQALRRVCRRECPKSGNGYLIGREAWRQRERWRFCPINFSSPAEYDLRWD